VSAFTIGYTYGQFFRQLRISASIRIVWVSIMRKFFYGFGIVMACLIAAGAVGIVVLIRDAGSLMTESKAYSAESKAYGDDAMLNIFTNWDADELWKRSTPHFRQAIKRDDLSAFFDAGKDALGRLSEYSGTGGATVTVTSGRKSVKANYMAKTRFEKGDADVRLDLIKDGMVWTIEGFHIDSSVLMKSLVGTRS
jgi:hypothetical protein